MWGTATFNKPFATPLLAQQQMAPITTSWMAIIGFVDDYIKVFLKNKRGLAGRFKILGQVGLGLIVGITMLWHPDFRGQQGLLNQANALRVNERLVSLGFMDGDEVVAVDGLPVPAEKMTTRPFSRWRMARRRMYGSAICFISMAEMRRV